ncbi:MAG TPA: Nudix family hydrolase [Burkholderiaceae bacterium]|nr:Nudix family hydrolase [Burkholderiaceae bacterium]
MAEPAPRIVDVAVGVVLRDDGAVLIGQRVPGKPYAGWWEFPGGKLEAGESVADALARELHEELGLDAVESEPWVVRGHAYPHATVRLFFRRVRRWRGEPQSREGQALVWRPADAIDVAPLLPAAIAPIGWLRLPATYRISCAAELGVAAWEAALHRELDALAAASPRGAMLLQLREPALPPAEFERLFARVRALRETRPLQVVVSSRHPASFARAVDGVHLTGRDLLAARERPRGRWVGASCHDRDGLEAAGALGCDFATMGPVRPTASHPGAPGIGFDGLAAAIGTTPVPVYALGGLAPADLERARAAGAHGVAAMRAAWRA